MPEILKSNEPDTLLSWMVLILPQMEQEALWETSVEACKADKYPYHNPPHVGYVTVIPSYLCPSDGRLRTPLTTAKGDFAAFTSYIGICGTPAIGKRIPGVMGNSPGISLVAITDGTSNTLMVAERPPPQSLQAGRWYDGMYILHLNDGPDAIMTIPHGQILQDPECPGVRGDYGPGRLDNPCDRLHPWSLHPGGANFLFADGTVRFISYSASHIMPALATRAGGESISDLD